MTLVGRYDTDLQMFVEPSPHTARLAHLEFLRWLIKTGRLAGDTIRDDPPPPTPPRGLAGLLGRTGRRVP